jgi:excisionase family DNA binding protein
MDMLTVKEAASRLGVSPKLIYALCAEGKIEHHRYGLGRGTIRISEAALERYQEGARVTHPNAALPPLKHLTAPSAG